MKRMLRKKQQGPSPRFQDLQYDRGTNLHVKEIGSCCSPRLSRSQIKMLGCEKCQTFEKSCVDLRRGNHYLGCSMCDENHQRISSSPLDLRIFLWTGGKILQTFWWGIKSVYRPFPPNQSQSKTDSHRWFLLSKISKLNSTQKTNQSVLIILDLALWMFFCADPFLRTNKQNQ